LFAARLEEVFHPLRESVAVVHGWNDQVSRIWDLMEALGGSLALANSLVLGGYEEPGSPIVAGGEETNVDGCSPEVEVRALTSYVPPSLDGALPQMDIHSVEEQAMVAEIVPLCNGMKLTEVSDHVSQFGGSGVPMGLVSSSLLDEQLSSFNCTAPLSLLDAPILVQIEGDSSCAERRSDRLDKKNPNFQAS
jgi:hypothetical protein